VGETTASKSRGRSRPAPLGGAAWWLANSGKRTPGRGSQIVAHRSDDELGWNQIRSK
jgi:hypothetical protein